MTFARDPVSLFMDEIADDLLRRAWRARPRWQSVYLSQPSAEWVAWAAANGQGNLLGPDPAPGGMARSRWGRAMVRSLYDQHRKHMTTSGLALGAERGGDELPPYALQVQVGTIQMLPPGRLVREVSARILSRRGAEAAVRKLPASRIWRDGGPAASGWDYHNEQ